MENNLRKTLHEHGFSLKKKYGQNFLSDQELLEEIVDLSGIDENTTVLEIGCGAGALTKVLAKKAKKVVGYEIDTTLKPVLEDSLFGLTNVEIIFNDIMKCKMSDVELKLPNDYVMVANLPYYITTPIVTNFLENSKKIKSMSIMVQEEVANRFSASAGESDYGAITVAIALRGSAKIIKHVGREKFTPVPNVDSAVVKIDIDKTKNAGVNFVDVRDVVRCAFSSRRKMLINNIMNHYKIKREDAERVLLKANVSLTARGEQLNESQFVQLTGIIKEIINV